MAIASSLGRALRRPLVVVSVAVVVLLIALRLALPALLTDYLNDLLDRPPDHEGYVGDLDLHFWRGAASLEGLRLYQIDDGERELLFGARDVHASVSWRALFRGSLVAEVEIRRPIINIVTPARAEEVKEEKTRLEDLAQYFQDMLPFVIDRFALVDGELHFRDPSASPDIDIYIDQLQVTARNLTNSERLSKSLWATVSATGRAMGSGDVRMEMRLNPNESRPTYDLAFELKDLSMPTLNSYLKHYLSVVARDGRLSLYAESVAREGGFEGYVKPVVKDLDILDVKEEKGVIDAVKGFFVKLIAQIFENEPKEQLATRIEFAGTFENPEVSVWEAVTMFARNAFVRALAPRLEGSVAPQQRRAIEGGRSGSRDGEKPRKQNEPGKAGEQ